MASTTPGLTGAASDDSGAAQPKPAGSTGGPVTSPAAAAGAGGTTPAGTTSVGGGTSNSTSTEKTAKSSDSDTKWEYSKVSTQSSVDNSQPGKRLKNPLGDLSSYTYQLSLYMVTPDAYDAFVATGRTKINIIRDVPTTGGTSDPIGGAYLVAQSAGVNEKEIPRAPYIKYDYGIDDLRLSTLTAREEGAPTSVLNIGFKIYEPYGFSFLTNLRKAGDVLYGSNKGTSAWGEAGSNKLRQLFILGIRFYGYDTKGNPTSALYEHFIDIQITSLKFKIDGRMVVYDIKAIQSNAAKAYNISRGVLKYQQNITASTVGEAVEQLLANINKEQKDLSSGKNPEINIPNRYEVVWMPGTAQLYNSSIVSPADISKQHWAGSGAKDSAESNVSKETKTQTADANSKQIQLSPNQPLLGCFQHIIKQSEFMENQLTVLFTTQEEANPKTKSQDAIKPAQVSHTLSWFNVTPQISSMEWDTKTKDWAYTIKYLITMYKTPVNDAPVVNPNNNLYPGPVKRYDYWYTGENTEIIRYEQVMDNTYMQVVVGVGDPLLDPEKPSGTTTPGNSGGQGVVPVQAGLQETMDRYGRTGYGSDAQNSFLTALFDAKAYLSAKVTIMGDPDWLPTTPTDDEKVVYDVYYGKGYGISTESSQVFIEIDFKEAIDYTSTTGTMNINESIAFVPYPKDMKNKPKGVSYQVLQIDHSFTSGIFNQTLTLIGNTFGDKENQEALGKKIDDANSRQAGLEQSAAQPPNPGSGTTSSNASPPAEKPLAPATATPAPQPATPTNNPTEA